MNLLLRLIYKIHLTQLKETLMEECYQTVNLTLSYLLNKLKELEVAEAIVLLGIHHSLLLDSKCLGLIPNLELIH